jgi:sigma-B regulation protein RsbU (phosphoserine phosphatase)
MALPYRYLRLRLSEAGLLPTSKLAFVTWYMLGLDLLLFALQQGFAIWKPSYGQNLGGWVTFLSFVVAVLFVVLAIRWIKTKMLWRLRNRLIVTYVFFGLIPVVLLVALAALSFYLFAGQFAAFVVTTGLRSELQTLEAANSAVAHGIAARLDHGGDTEAAVIDGLRRTEREWAVRHVQVLLDDKVVLNSFPAGAASSTLVCPASLPPSFREVTRDHDKLFLRAAKTVSAKSGKLTVISGEAFDQRLLQGLADNLGEITLYEGVVPTYSAGAVPPPYNGMDLQVTFPTSVRVVNWESGRESAPAAITVQTRVSKLRERMFEGTGEFTSTVEFVLLGVAIFFAVIELFALWIGTHLTRTVTGAVAQIYNATRHINRGDFSHRIPIRSTDQLSALATSFNSMTASLEQLIEEQKQKQRLENELAIAQEVQEQLYPRHISQLASLEVYGFCRPARTVSGDYYDFLKLDSEKLLLAVGDISGKGISAALLMATIHSAVRAYSLEGIPILREAVAVGAGLGSGTMLGTRRQGTEVSPGNLLALLNHQLYESTPMEKYATLFLGVYDGEDRKFTYSNGGHLPPIVLAEDGSLRRLESGGTVVGLFDNCSYEEGSVQLRRGEIFLAYSDGVTEPENDFGEFGEQRLIELVQENRDLPLARITEIVTAAVDDWIGANEQPDDVTLVLARAR